eukprot:g17048.t1
MLSLIALLFGISAGLLKTPALMTPRELELYKRQELTKDAFRHAWKSYEKGAWEHDELKPISKSATDGYGAYGVTVFEALDSMIIMGLAEKEEGSMWMQSRTWVSLIEFERDTTARVFDIISTYAGSLLAAYYLTHDDMFLHRAQTLADHVEATFKPDNVLLNFFLSACSVRRPRLITWRRPSRATTCLLHIAQTLADHVEAAFKGDNVLPYARLDMRTKVATGETVDLASLGGYQLEFRALSEMLQETGTSYKKQADAVFQAVVKYQEENDLTREILPRWWNASSGLPLEGNHEFGVGPGFDCYYEYLLKAWLQSGKTLPHFRTQYEREVAAIRAKLIAKSTPSGLTWVRTIDTSTTSNSFNQLTCYLPGLLALGSSGPQDPDLALAKELMYTCYQLFKLSPTGLPSDTTEFSDAAAEQEGNLFDFSPPLLNGDQYTLHPNIAASLFYLYRTTLDPMYQDWGWDIFQSIVKNCNGTGGFNEVMGVNSGTITPIDIQPSEVTGSILKFFYLLWADPSVMPVDKWVFNHEGHALPVKGPLPAPLFSASRYLSLGITGGRSGSGWDKFVLALLILAVSVAVMVVVGFLYNSLSSEDVAMPNVLGQTEEGTELAKAPPGGLELSEDEGDGDLSDVQKEQDSDEEA